MPQFDPLLQDKPVEILYWPSYQNPYQRLFYGRDGEHYLTRPGCIDEALEAAQSSNQKDVCFHVHWLNSLFKKNKNSTTAHDLVEEFLQQCFSFKRLGGLVIWTIHNAEEHECPEPELEFRLRKELGQLADIVIMHSCRNNNKIIEELGIQHDKVLIIEHGSYINVYENAVPRHLARQRFKLRTNVTSFLNLGFMRPYKGIDQLIGAVSQLNETGKDASLTLAGSASKEDSDYLTMVAKEKLFIQAYCGWVKDDDVQYYMNAADFVVLPYKNILTSGSALLSLSFGKPVIAPKRGALVDLLEDGQTGFLYNPEEENGLLKALLRGIETPVEKRFSMSQAALSQASKLLWSDARAKLIGGIRSINDR
ncbi:GDP-mannose:glycolipid 4-beta-D-mannosyltransferase precursor [Pseudovibrio axinellae]|uniref:GDP-mannose:glycolipid 4-beta-D-mannosyltransferase n=2 Tax=Pseudovibrio axinellae TaxID=989403 RepID=A0A165W2D0_9HYPH|nr:GDP-mannose:glycolipid 4-beta-D-mannosyltransferase precursor [Pseudovibrio axinellae]SER83024.1 Glycosyl transferases group 1 [Pseudovibrio axinellae]